MKYLFCTIAFACFSIAVFSQVNPLQDSDEDPVATYIHYHRPQETYTADTTLDGFFLSDRAGGTQPFTVALGNSGLPLINLLFKPKQPGYQLGFSQYEGYLWSPENARQYNPSFPYTHLRYILGAQNEQIFRATHAQTIKNRLNFGVDVHMISAPGLYEHQHANTSNLHIYSRFRSKNRRYEVTAGYLANNIENELNGGTILNTDSVFSFFKKNTVPVNMTGATVDYNKRYYYLQQSMNMGGQFAYRVNDSTTYNLLVPKSTFYHRFLHERELYHYRDLNPDTAFLWYEHSYLSLDSTSDKTYSRRIENWLGWQNTGISAMDSTGKQFTGLLWQIQTGHTLTMIYQEGREFAENDWMIDASLSSHPKVNKPYRFSVRGRYDLAGQRAGDARVDLSVNRSMHANNNIHLRANYWISSPGFTEQHYLSNHYYWENDFVKNHTARLGLSWSNKALHTCISADYYLLNHHIYRDSTGHPVQHDKPISIFQSMIKSRITSGKFRFEITLSGQFTGSRQVIRLPEFLARGRVYYQSHFFNKAMLAQLGVETSYTSPYPTLNFNPVTGQIQNYHVSSLTSYPVIDAFFNFRIKDARVFFKFSHVNQGLLFPAGYFILPSYPAPDRAFRFGVSWIFRN